MKVSQLRFGEIMLHVSFLSQLEHIGIYSSYLLRQCTRQTSFEQPHLTRCVLFQRVKSGFNFLKLLMPNGTTLKSWNSLRLSFSICISSRPLTSSSSGPLPLFLPSRFTYVKLFLRFPTHADYECCLRVTLFDCKDPAPSWLPSPFFLLLCRSLKERVLRISWPRAW